MANFNKKTKTSLSAKPIKNFAGGDAYKPSDKLELMLLAMSNMLSGDQYYVSNEYTKNRIDELVARITSNDKKFVLNLAAYARNEMYLRSLPTYLLVEYSRQPEKLEGAYGYVSSILQRADEPGEALALYMSKSGNRKIPNMLKKGIGMAMNNFNAYQLQKYNNKKAAVTMRGVLMMTHPSPKDEKQAELYNDLWNDQLPTPHTWETVISAKGSTKKAWDEVIPDMGYMALLKNLNNFVKSGADLDPVIAKLTDPKEVKNSKQLPYRFYSAYNALTRSSEVVPSDLLDAVQTALEISVDNVDKIMGRTLIIGDNSGSMDSTVSDKSDITCKDIGSLFGAMAHRICEDSTVSVFANDFKLVPISGKSSVLDNMYKIKNTQVGGATHAHKAFEWLRSSGEKYDRIMLFSDMQCYNDAQYMIWQDRGAKSVSQLLALYRREVNQKCRMYSFDLNHYGTLAIPENDRLTCPIGGWSENVFRFVNMFESDHTTMLSDVENYV